MSVILKAENISKQYRLGTVGTGTLGHDLNRWWHTVRGKEDPYLKIGGINDRSAKATEDYVWALRNINFEVNTGEVLGIIGKNGAGKTTLLKLLSRVTAPTTGTIKTRGRIASLLEVGTGFHGELTGRENIFMNGAVLGMTKNEIKRKLDEIIDFSGCEMYIDTPVKRYSSGMTVRLGFAVAAHLDPEILVVDEVLAVGDAEFQKKAIGKMQNLSHGEGRTVLFVSHNMASVKKLCDRGVLLNNGGVELIGDTDKIISHYEKEAAKISGINDFKNYERPNKNLGREVYFIGVKVFNESNENTTFLRYKERFYIELELETNLTSIENLNLGVRFETIQDNYITSTLSGDSKNLFSIFKKEHKLKVRVDFEKFFLSPGEYYMTLSIRKGKVFYDQLEKAIKIKISNYGIKKGIYHSGAWGFVELDSNWNLID